MPNSVDFYERIFTVAALFSIALLCASILAWPAAISRLKKILTLIIGCAIIALASFSYSYPLGGPVFGGLAFGFVLRKMFPVEYPA
jgi:hypothetical protein